MLSVVSIQSCCASKQEVKQINDMESDSKTYTITSLYENNTTDENVFITFNFSEKKISGYSGCNSFSGTFEINGSKISFGPIATTKRMCPDISNEDLLFKVLDNNKKLVIASNTLEIQEVSGNTILVAKEKTGETKLSQENLTFDYTAGSRGFYLMVKVSNIDNKVFIKNSYSMKPEMISYSSEEWDNLVIALEKIELDSLNSIEPPSKDFRFDGAPFTKLKITVNDVLYETQAFDHGNPPKELNELVNLLLSFTEKD